MRVGLLLVAVLALSGCEEPRPAASAPLQPQGDAVREADKQAIFDKGRIDAERNSKIGERPRRFHGDSL